jgi:hypothetical protein
VNVKKRRMVIDGMKQIRSILKTLPVILLLEDE